MLSKISNNPLPYYDFEERRFCSFVGGVPFMGGGGINAGISHKDSQSSTSNSTSYTFNSCAIGEADATRIVVVAMAWNGASSSISSVTIGGNTATVQITGDNTSKRSAIATYALTTGTTANIVVNLAATADNMQVNVYALYGAKNETPAATKDGGGGSSGTSISLDLSAGIGCVFLAVAFNNAGSAISWTGGTEDNETTVETTYERSVASGTITAIPHTLSASWSSAGAYCGCSAAWALTAVHAPVLTLIGSTSSTVDQTTYTFSSQSIGSASADRIVAVCIEASTTQTISIVTIGGTTATIAVQVSTSGTDKGPVGIAYLAVNSGTTADIVVTLSGTGTRCAIQVFTITGSGTVVPTSTNTSTATAPSAALTPWATGAILACAKSLANSSCTWTNATEDVDAVVETALTVTAAHENSLAASSRTLTATFGTSSSPGMAMAAWG